MIDELKKLRIPQIEAEPSVAEPEPDRCNGWIKGQFLKGRIPLTWLGRACRLPGGKVLAVALAIWYVAGVKKRMTDLPLTTKTLEKFGVTNRSAKGRAIKILVKAGLITNKQTN